jgi:diguanylate cyclase (GGDEF)-like protein
MKVLIAEDDAVSRMILRRAVEKLGHECLSADDGAEAWEMYREVLDVDVIISDWMMPGMDGLELCNKVRDDMANRDGYTFFVFLTALGDKEHALKGLQAGADDYLSKPLDRAELRARLIAATRVTSLHKQLTQQREELKRLNRELFWQARTDPLTRLGNRLRLREDLETLKARVDRYGHTYCVVLCDLDWFKLYNDRHGHLAGDEILQRVANVIVGTFRTGDSSYRFGGEEFLVVLPEQSLKSAAVAAGRLRAGVEAMDIPHEGQAEPAVVTISAGVATLVPGVDKSPEDLIQEADKALYRAKELGKNRVVTYDETPEAREAGASSSSGESSSA